MKALNKFLSLILFCAMVMSLCIPAFASERMSSEELDTPFIMDIDNGKLFSAESDDKIVAILTNDDLHLIDISISYSPARDEVYHWAISDYPDDEFSYNDSFWTATQYLTGGKILIGNYAYTLGPALSASKAYSAGHGFSGTVDVKDLMGTKIGSATSHLGSLSGDWSKITPYGGEFFPVVAKATPIAGKQVYMLGATSGETVGKITRTGVSVQFPPYVTLTDMCEGNYECNPGDSGAGLFDSGAKDVLTASSNAKTYGIQSSGKFNEKGEWIGPSYFTPISNVS